MKHIDINKIRRAMALVAVIFVVTATALAQTVNYIDKDGKEQTCETYEEVGTTITAWNAGWYLVNSTVEINGGVTVTGEVHLILGDGASLTVTGAAGKAGVNVSGTANSLTVYGQAEGTGKLIANGMGYANGTGGGAGIGGNDMQAGGNITVNGGIVTANGGGGGAGIGGGADGTAYNIEINRGTVTANGSLLSTGIGMGATTQVTETDEWIDFNDPTMGVSGLPKWSKKNVGATNGTTKESWYGDYYAWGEIEPYYADGHAYDAKCSNWRTMTTGAGNTNIAKGYEWKTYSQGGASYYFEWTDKPYDNTTKILKPARDAASQVVGGDWRMPTTDEWKALYDNNTFEWVDAGATSQKVPSFKAVASGYLVIKGGKNGIQMDTSVYMFLPAVGGRHKTYLDDVGSYGYYWSSSHNTIDPSYALSMYFCLDGVFPQTIDNRCYGLSVRPVHNAPNTTATLTLNDGANTAAKALEAAWNEGDVVKVYDGETQVGTLNYRNHDGSTATFTGYINKGIDEGTQLTFRRGTTPAFTEQNGTLATLQANYSLEGTATYNASENYIVTMGTPYAVMRLDLSAFGTASPGTTVTISVGTPSEVVASVTGVTTTPKELYVAMPAAASREYTFSGNSLIGRMTWELAANKFYTKSGSSTGGAIVVAPTPKFSVSATKTVEFSKGNLYWDGAFHFEANQWDFQPTAEGTWNTSHVSHFFWSNTTDWKTSGKEPYAAAYSSSAQNVNDKFFTEASDFTVDGQAGWSTLTQAEWDYLLYTRANAESLRKWVTLTVSGKGEVNGLVILPDGDAPSPAILAAIDEEYLTSNNAVFLPAAGSRFDTKVYSVGSGGSYYSSTPYEENESHAWYMSFYSGNAYEVCSTRKVGCCVRLVR